MWYEIKMNVCIIMCLNKLLCLIKCMLIDLNKSMIMFNMKIN